MEYLKVFVSFAEVIEPLADDERGRLFMAMLAYADTGEVIDLPGNERILWPAAKQQIDREAGVLERKRAAGRMGGEAKASNANHDLAEPSTSKQSEAKPSYKDKDKDKDKETLSIESVKKEAQRFRPPTEEEVRQYVQEKHFLVDPDRFFAHYSANGWKVGKNPMKDWRAAVRYWAAVDRKDHPKSAYRNEDLEKMEINLEKIGLLEEIGL